VFRAKLSDIEFAGGFLLGCDVGAIAASEDRSLIARFLTRVEATLDEAPALDLEGRDTLRFRLQIAAFRKGMSRLDSA
jgi:hypothetical protein